MKVGTKSLLFGVHAIWLHPFFVLAGWHRLYGWPNFLQAWVAIVVHDWGYWGKPNMDGPEGETHVELGGRIMQFLFRGIWGDWTRRHSRSWSVANNTTVSQLCYADKMAFVLTPCWLYLFLARLSGEVDEYVAKSKGDGKYAYAHSNLTTLNQQLWYEQSRRTLLTWVAKETGAE